MTPKFTSYRFRLAGLALALWVNAFIVLRGHRITASGIVILAVAEVLFAIIPESPGKKPEPEKYPLVK